jgi:hypothetical protein
MLAKPESTSTAYMLRRRSSVIEARQTSQEVSKSLACIFKSKSNTGLWYLRKATSSFYNEVILPFRPRKAMQRQPCQSQWVCAVVGEAKETASKDPPLQLQVR